MTKTGRYEPAHQDSERTQSTTTDPAYPYGIAPERLYSIVALEPVHDKKRFLGLVRRVFYHNETLPDDPDTLWGEQGSWEDDDRWDPESGLGRKFFALCKQELFSLTEPERVAEWVSECLRFLRNVTIQLIDDESLNGEVPVRMVWRTPSGSVSNWDLSPWCQRLGFGVGAFAEYGQRIRKGQLCPIGWYGWACGDEMPDEQGKSEALRTKPLGKVVWNE